MEISEYLFPETLKMSAHYEGLYDVTGQMRQNVEIFMEIPEEDNQSVYMDIYLVGDFIYVRMHTPPEEEEWMKIPADYGVGDDMLDEANMLSETMYLYESPYSVKEKRYEQYNGEQCHIIEVIPNFEKLFEWVLDQESSMITVAQEDDSEEMDFYLDLFKEISYRLWISTETGYIKKMESYVLADMTNEDLEESTFPTEMMKIEIIMSTILYDYNVPFTIELPPEAENAPYIFDTEAPEI